MINHACVQFLFTRYLDQPRACIYVHNFIVYLCEIYNILQLFYSLLIKCVVIKDNEHYPFDIDTVTLAVKKMIGSRLVDVILISKTRRNILCTNPEFCMWKMPHNSPDMVQTQLHRDYNKKGRNKIWASIVQPIVMTFFHDDKDEFLDWAVI